ISPALEVAPQLRGQRWRLVHGGRYVGFTASPDRRLLYLRPALLDSARRRSTVKPRLQLLVVLPMTTFLLTPGEVGARLALAVVASVLAFVLLAAYTWLRSTLLLLPLDQ